MPKNALSHAKSLYLQQHAHHPVHWQEWSEEAFARAKSEHKLVVLSIGYSACHWCHVMAEESFEDGAVADLMNAEFVSVKIDREELPDVDALYMQAAQLMGVRGGWPLNVICTPDKQAVWTTTYLPKERWASSLRQLAQLYRKEPNTVAEYAEKLTHALQATPAESQEHFQLRLEDFLQVENHFDYEYGGLSGAPKFPLFPLLQASLDIGVLRAKPTLLQWVHHSLEVLSRSALYDQLEGGFARYTVDEAWELPHFEKMLYDNALAILIYAKAQQQQPSEMYERILEESSHWLRRVMKGDGALIAGSMDAVNSQGEGAYYTWTIPELQACLGEHFSDFDRHFKLKAFDQLEGRATLLLKEEAQLHELDTLRGKMLLARAARPQPAIDPKLVTQWNGLLAEAWISAYDSSLQEKYLDWAQAIVDGLLDRYFKSDKLYRAYYGEEGQGAASLEDYSAGLSALIQLIGRRPSTAYFSAIDALFGQVQREFAREGTPFFALRSNVEAPLIAEQFVLQDQVTPSGNSQMAINLWRWGHISGRVDLLRQSESMLQALPKEEVTQHALYYSQWHLLQSWMSGSYYSCLISGPEADDWRAQLQQPYRPNRCYLLNDQKREFGLYAHRYDEKTTRMYICEGMHCRLPIDNLDDAQAALSKV